MLKVIIGASTKSPRLAPAGTMVSLNRNLTPSATGCSSPKGPTTFGPLRSWIAAHTLPLEIGDEGDRQQQRHHDREDVPDGQEQRVEIGTPDARLSHGWRLPPAAATNAALHSVMVWDARVIGSVR